MKSQKSEKQREHEKLVLQLNEIFPTHSLQDLITAVKKSNFDLDAAIAIVLSEFPLPEVSQPSQTEKKLEVVQTEKIKEKEAEHTVKQESSPKEAVVEKQPEIPEEKIEKIQLVLSHLSRKTICKALLENDLDDDLTLLQLLNNPPEEDSLIPPNSSKQEQEEEEEDEEEEEFEEEEEDNEFYGSSTPSDSDNDVEMEAWFVDPQVERQEELTRRYIETLEKEAQIKRDEQIALNLQKLEEQRNKDKNMSFSTWATTDLSRINICAYDNAKKDNYGNVKDNTSSKKIVAPSSVIVEPPSQEVRDFLDRIEERTVLELTGSIPPPKKSNQYTSIKLQNVLLDLKKRLAEYQGLKSKKLPWEILQEKLKNSSISTTTTTTSNTTSFPNADALFATISTSITVDSESTNSNNTMSLEDMKSKQNEEIEALKSFYSQEFSESLSYPKRFSVKLSYSPSLSIYIIFILPPLYPVAFPQVLVRSFSFISIPENLIIQLENYLQSMLKSKNSFLSVVQFSNDWLQSVAPTLALSTDENTNNEYQDSFKFIVSGNYKCLSTAGLLEEQNQKIRNTCLSLNVSPSIARILLNHYKWQPKDLYKSYEESIRKGLLNDFYRSMELPVDLINSFSTTIDIDPHSEYECSSCFDEFNIKDMTSLYCNHRFCNDCFKSYLKIKIMESGSSVDVITCPGHKCKFIVDECTIGSLVTMDLYSKYTSFVTKSFVDRNPNLKYCPSKKCESIVLLNSSNNISSSSSSHMIHCNCGLIWCYSCKLEAHWPASCEQIKWYNDTHHRQNQDPDASEKTLEWLSKYTQDCPKCKSPIEKNGGCNHLSCSFCKYSFCWVCRGEWTGGSHYNCSSPQSQSSADRELALRFSVTNLSFEQVYIINERSRVHDDQRIKSIATDRMKSYIQLPNATIEDCEVICAAIEHIFLCRHIILNICIMGQYFNKFKAAKGKKLKQWIENLQSSINLLSSVIDVPVKQISIKTIQNFTIAVQNAIKKLQSNLVEFKQQKNVNKKKH